MSNKVLVICGPTASGKTALAIKLAGNKLASIISADSRQVYAGLDIVTGKDIPAGFHKEKNYYTDGVLRLFGFDLCKPNERFSAGQYSDYIWEVIDREIKENRQVIIVGGTGFYLKSLTQPGTLAKIPPDETLRKNLEKLSKGKLQQKLKNLDLERFASMNQSDVNNPRRLIRAIEIVSFRSSPEFAQFDKFDKFDQSYVFSWIGLKISLDDLKPRIEKRVHDRLDQGATTEVENLLKHYPDQSLPVYTTLGVKPILRYLAGEIGNEQLRQLWITSEVNYAKRQLTWFKKQSEIVWYDVDA